MSAPPVFPCLPIPLAFPARCELGAKGAGIFRQLENPDGTAIEVFVWFRDRRNAWRQTVYLGLSFPCCSLQWGWRAPAALQIWLWLAQRSSPIAAARFNALDK